MVFSLHVNVSGHLALTDDRSVLQSMGESTWSIATLNEIREKNLSQLRTKGKLYEAWSIDSSVPHLCLCCIYRLFSVLSLVFILFPFLRLFDLFCDNLFSVQRLPAHNVCLLVLALCV